MVRCVHARPTFGVLCNRWSDAVVWNPYLTMEACYKDFVCVENAQVGHDSTLAQRSVWYLNHSIVMLLSQ